MAEVIYKYPFDMHSNFSSIEMPKGATICHVGIQTRRICLWAIVPTDSQETEVRHFCFIGTGQTVEFHDKMTHIGSVQTDPDGVDFVWHVFEEMHS